MHEHQTYENPLGVRYASREMLYNFSPEKKFRTWRRLWVALAEVEQELGLPITEAQIAELRAHQDDTPKGLFIWARRVRSSPTTPS